MDVSGRDLEGLMFIINNNAQALHAAIHDMHHINERVSALATRVDVLASYVKELRYNGNGRSADGTPHADGID